MVTCGPVTRHQLARHPPALTGLVNLHRVLAQRVTVLQVEVQIECQVLTTAPPSLSQITEVR
ncbi:hypothetical protein E2C01_029913 [Portunus trituberculatus]|uniref:Uncharacterized protein n=1 Tax=Portunus trituberculatus TaxID=210409 RepID=A0A5B7EST4_PORTR|nr:hypothetical protein [Portunus trituberculatus]